MSLQLAAALLAVLAAAAWALRGLVAGFRDPGCASGCGGCRREGCPLPKLEAMAREPKKPGPTPA